MWLTKAGGDGGGGLIYTQSDDRITAAAAAHRRHTHLCPSTSVSTHLIIWVWTLHQHNLFVCFFTSLLRRQQRSLVDTILPSVFNILDNFFSLFSFFNPKKFFKKRSHPLHHSCISAGWLRRAKTGSLWPSSIIYGSANLTMTTEYVWRSWK